jgi:hypothetical protein
MARVTGKFPHITTFGLESSFTVNSDQAMIYFSWAPPIKWTGKVAGVDVEFTQISSSALFQDDFDFTGFPENLKNSIPYIIDAINEAMRIMD